MIVGSAPVFASAKFGGCSTRRTAILDRLLGRMRGRSRPSRSTSRRTAERESSASTRRALEVARRGRTDRARAERSERTDRREHRSVRRESRRAGRSRRDVHQHARDDAQRAARSAPAPSRSIRDCHSTRRAKPADWRQQQFACRPGALKGLFGNFSIEVGRDYALFGQSPTGGLLLSENAPPLDMVRHLERYAVRRCRGCFATSARCAASHVRRGHGARRHFIRTRS